MAEGGTIIPINIEDEMRGAYIDYSMSVIISRALPDARDGLKPVHRRVLFGMAELGVNYNKPYKKCARIVGDVLGKYHPHGDASVYDTMVRMAQEWSLRYPLVDGQGNFGSIDGDSPAAMRYCLTGDVRIKTERGLVQLHHLVPHTQANSDNDLSAKVLSIHGQENTASKFFNSGKHPVYHLQTKEGFALKGTANHPVLVFTKDTTGKPVYVWKLLQDIRPGDQVVIDRTQKNLNDRPATESEKNWAIIAAGLIAEGFVTEKRLGFNNTDKAFFDAFCRAYRAEVGDRFYSDNRVLPSGKTIYEFDVQNNSDFKAKCPMWTDPVGLKSADKRIPDYIFTAPREAQKVFLQYLFEGDGAVSMLEKNTINLQYCTKSPQLAADIQLLLLEFGVVGKIASQRRREECKVYISGYHNIVKFGRTVGFASAKSEKLQELIEVEGERRSAGSPRYGLTKDYIPYIAAYIKQYHPKYHAFLYKNNIDRYERIDAYYEKILAVINGEHLKNLFQQLVADRYYFATVSDCQALPEEQMVYSVKVDSECHSFVANGLINHNTEARLKRIAEEMLTDIYKETVDFQPNYDDSTQEPTVLPSKIPNLLLNGSSGIAVGMATNMAPHNLTEVVDGIIAYIHNNEITIAELMEHIKAPDFPTGGIIYGYQGVKSAFETGRGRIVIRANATFETTKTGREMIVVSSVPYMVNKASMIERTAELVNEGKIEGISALRDESDREGIRVVYELKKDAVPAVVLNNLYRYTQLQTSFGVNNVALVKGRPVTLNLKDMIRVYVEHRHEVVIRRARFELREAEKRSHILQGLLIALDNIDAVISLIRSSRDPEEAKLNLMRGEGFTNIDRLLQRAELDAESIDAEGNRPEYVLSEVQAKAILEMRLQRLTGLEREKIVKEFEEVQELIRRLNQVLSDEGMRMQIIIDELNEMKERYGDARRSEIVFAGDDFTDEDMIADDEMVITITHAGYIKRTPLAEYRTQGRGGVGSRGASSREDDFTEHLFVATNHNYLLIFTELGKLFWLKVYAIPEGGKTAKGRAIQNLIQIEASDKVRAVINVKNLNDPDYVNNNYLIMCTAKGTIKKTLLEAYSRPRQAGINAITINDGDRLLNVALTNGSNDILIAAQSGMAIRFNEIRVRPMGRTAAGVRGISLDNEEDKVVGMVCISRPDAQLLVVSEKGYGKRSSVGDYRITNRGGKGVKTLNITDKTGHLVAIKEVTDSDELMIINRSGITIRMPIAELRVMGRNTQGVRLIRLNENDEISSVAKIEKMDEAEAEVKTETV